MDFDRIASIIIANEPKIRSTAEYFDEDMRFFDYIQACDVSEMKWQARFYMNDAIRQGKLRNKQYNRALRIQFLVAYDWYSKY